MKKITIIRAGNLVLAGATFTGCVSVHKVTLKDEPRKTVRFENAEAMQTFYEAILAKYFPHDGKPSQVRIGNTLYTTEIRPAMNVVFNNAVTATDIDSDGIISAKEAENYTSSSSR